MNNALSTDLKPSGSRNLGYAACTALLIFQLGCAQDPLKVPAFGDGGPLGDAVMDSDVGIRLDGRVDTEQDMRADISFDACIAQIEFCNNLDDNCNGQIDEGFDRLNDTRYCEDCKGCKDLLGKNAIPACQLGKCTIGSCVGGFIDANSDPSDGCEYICTPTGVEVCDGVDNDCDGQTDNGVSLSQQICKALGACAGATATCQGGAGWVCQYGSQVELQPCAENADCGAGNRCDLALGVCPNLVIVDETTCDGVDGDCDGQPDDPWANPSLPNALGTACDPVPPKACTSNPECAPASGSTCLNNQCTARLGICKDVGEYACNSTQDGVVCQLQTAGQLPQIEICNDKDDDCNGTVDDNVTDEAWVTVGAFDIFEYEATRPDATASDSGIQSTGRPCSVPGRFPWTNVTRTAAQDACVRAGARLCTVGEWQTACRGAANATYPYGTAFDPGLCNGRAFDPGVDEVLVTDVPATCQSDWGAAGSIYNMSGNVKEWVATSFSGGNPVDYETKGGAYDTPSIPSGGDGLSCNYQLPAAPSPSLQLPNLGFRCCR